MDIPLDTVLRTQRCVLRSPIENDIECVLSASRHPGFTDGMLWDPPASKQEALGTTKGAIERWKNGKDFGFSLCLQDGTCIGRIAIRMDGHPKIWNTGFWLHPDYWGQGYMTEALSAIGEWGFTVLNAEAIESSHAVWNEASRKLLIRCGFTHVRHNPHGFKKHGTWVEAEEYVLKKDDWERNRSTI